MMKIRDFVNREIRDVLMNRHVGFDASRAVANVFECELALKIFLVNQDFSGIVSAWSAAKRGLIYALSPRSEAILRMVDTLNRWSHEGLLSMDDIFDVEAEGMKDNDNDVA